MSSDTSLCFVHAIVVNHRWCIKNAASDQSDLSEEILWIWTTFHLKVQSLIAMHDLHGCLSYQFDLVFSGIMLVWRDNIDFRCIILYCVGYVYYFFATLIKSCKVDVKRHYAQLNNCGFYCSMSVLFRNTSYFTMKCFLTQIGYPDKECMIKENFILWVNCYVRYTAWQGYLDCIPFVSLFLFFTFFTTTHPRFWKELTCQGSCEPYKSFNQALPLNKIQ